jgi:hypothetical protein
MKKISFMYLKLILILITSIKIKSQNSFTESEKILTKKLFKDYDKYLRPADTVQLKFSMYLNSIITIIEKEQIIIVNVYLDHEWSDDRLKWNPIENDNISLLRVNSELIWVPDTFIDKVADYSGFATPIKGSYFILTNKGLLFWSNPIPQLKLRCKMDIKWFPYDYQLCSVTFGSWSFTLNLLNYSMLHESLSFKNYTENSEWILINVRSSRFEINYEHWFDNNSFSEIFYEIILKRKSLFVVQNYVIPASFLCTLSLASFYIPFPQGIIFANIYQFYLLIILF